MAQNITGENFQSKLNEKEICLIDVWAEWCGPCRQLSPIIDQISQEKGEEITVGKLDADSNMELCKTLNVRNIPTLLYYKNGELMERSSGLKTKNEILETLKSLNN